MQNTIIVGLTGPTGAGKSEVCGLLARRGYRVIDADVVARQVVEKGRQCLLDLAIEFGIEILNADGTLNRRRLGSMVFADKEKRKRLNQITHPYIQQEIYGMLEDYRKTDEKAVFLDAPTLIESGTHKGCDKVVSVLASPEERFVRIVRRDDLSDEEAQKRMNAQNSDEFYIEHSDFVIRNDGDLTALRVQVVEMLNAVGIPLLDEGNGATVPGK